MELIDGRGKKLVVDPLISSFGGLQSGSAENLTDERRCSALSSGDKPSQVPNVEVQPLAIELEQTPAPVCVRERHRDREVHPTRPGRQRGLDRPRPVCGEDEHNVGVLPEPSISLSNSNNSDVE